MQVDFRNRRLRDAYERYADAERRWGEAVARKYIQRIDTLHTIGEFEEVKTIRAYRPHPLGGQRQGQWALDLAGRWRLIVIPSEDGKAVTIQEVTNHYGD